MRIYCSLIILFFSIQTVGCGGSARFKVREPVPNDMMNISQPAERNINIIADAFDKQIIEQIEQSLDLSRQLRKHFREAQRGL